MRAAALFGLALVVALATTLMAVAMAEAQPPHGKCTIDHKGKQITVSSKAAERGHTRHGDAVETGCVDGEEPPTDLECSDLAGVGQLVSDPDRNGILSPGDAVQIGIERDWTIGEYWTIVLRGLSGTPQATLDPDNASLEVQDNNVFTITITDALSEELAIGGANGFVISDSSGIGCEPLETTTLSGTLTANSKGEPVLKQPSGKNVRLEAKGKAGKALKNLAKKNKRVEIRADKSGKLKVKSAKNVG
jgi:hypothetical protein